MATESLPDRPFGLTLMAALNLGFGIYNVGKAVQLALGLKLRADPSNPPGFDPSIMTALLALPPWYLWFMIAVSVLSAGLLFVSAWGLFNFKRVGGRMVANGYALLSLGESAVTLAALPYGVHGGTIIGVLYPVFLLLALNTMFKPVLTR